MEVLFLSSDPAGPVTTGVPGLDEVLGGGIARGGMFFLVGAPGVGKTILSLQLAFHKARLGRRVLFLTTLSEPHNKLLAHTRNLAFFDADLIGNGLELLNLQSLVTTSVEETVESVVSPALKDKVSLVVIDGLNGLLEVIGSNRSAPELLYELGAKLGLLGVTLVVSIQADPAQVAAYPAFTLSDGILGMHYERRGAGRRRYLEVLKLRGAEQLDGLHSFAISLNGVTCYPQQESVRVEEAHEFPGGRLSSGVPGLDAMLGGGLNEATTTVLAGGPGTGKTVVGLQFLLAGAERGEPGLFVGFHESQAQLLAKARGVGLDLAGGVQNGMVQLLTQPPVRLDPDIVLHEVRRRVDQYHIRRLVVDPSLELERTLDASRAPDFLASVVAYLRARRVTSLLTREIGLRSGTDFDLTDTAAAVLAENLLLLRQVESQVGRHSLVSVLRMRFSDHDRRPHQLRMTDRGIEVLGGAFPEHGILTHGSESRAGRA